jgi:hypothetical protein
MFRDLGMYIVCSPTSPAVRQKPASTGFCHMVNSRRSGIDGVLISVLIDVSLRYALSFISSLLFSSVKFSVGNLNIDQKFSEICTDLCN